MKRVFIGICILLIIFLNSCGNSKNLLYTDKSKISGQGNSYNLNVEEQCIDDNSYKGKIKFEGMDTIWEYDCNSENKVEISYLLSVSKGSAKLVLITPDNEVKTIVESSKEDNNNTLETTILDLQKGENRIKLVAKNNSKINLEMKASEGKIYKLGFK